MSTSATAFLAIVWFVVQWFLYYQAGAIKSPQQEVKQEIIAVQKKKAAELEKTLAKLNDSILVHEWANKPEVVSAGETVYLTNCTACHGADLSATMQAGAVKVPLPGLPLNDHQWKFGGKPMDLFKLINAGSPPESTGHNGAKMQAWGQTMSPKQIAEVTAYLISKLPEDFKDIPAK